MRKRIKRWLKERMKIILSCIILLALWIALSFLLSIALGEVGYCLETSGAWDFRQDRCFYSCESWPGKEDCTPKEYDHEATVCLANEQSWDAKYNRCLYSCRHYLPEEGCTPDEYEEVLTACLKSGSYWDTQENTCRAKK